MAESKKLIQLKERYSELCTHRSAWLDHMTTIQDLVMPDTSDFQHGRHFRGERRRQRIYDSTAPWAAEMFAAGLHSYLTSPTERWFRLTPIDDAVSRLSRDARLWLEYVADTIYHYYSIPEAGLKLALHEVYLSLGGYGSGPLYQFEGENGLLGFRAYQLGDCYFDENHMGVVDVIFRKLPMNTRQLIQEFPHMEYHKEVKAADDLTSWEVVHAIFPRTDRKPDGLNISTNKKFASFHFSPSLDVILDEGGYDDFPVHCPRWTKLAGETMGRSPSMSVLPDIEMINQMSKELIYAAQLANMPPLVFDEDSMLLSVKTVTPKTIMFKQAGSEMPQALMSGSQPQLTIEVMDQRRESIRQAFFVDFLLRPKKKERQTTLEIQDDRTEMLRQMGPMLGRVESELLDYLIRRSFRILARRNKFPEPPAELSGRPLKIVYSSPAAQAQYGTKAVAVSQFLQDLAQVAQFDPQAVQALDSDELISELARLRDVTRKILKDPAILKQEREAMAQQAQMQQMGETLPGVSGAIKDIAQARQADPTLVQQLTG